MARFFNINGHEKIKIPSGEINNIPLLKKAASYNLSMILSTGMSNVKEIDLALKEIKKINNKLDICLLHCTSYILLRTIV